MWLLSVKTTPVWLSILIRAVMWATGDGEQHCRSTEVAERWRKLRKITCVPNHDIMGLPHDVIAKRKHCSIFYYQSVIMEFTCHCGFVKAGSLPYLMGTSGPRNHPCPCEKSCADSIETANVLSLGFSEKENKEMIQRLRWAQSGDVGHTDCYSLDINVKTHSKAEMQRKDWVLRIMNMCWETGYLVAVLKHIPGIDDGSQRLFLPGWQPGHCSLSICNLRDLQRHAHTHKPIY